MQLLETQLFIVGIATIALGVVHLVIPRLIDIEHAVPSPVQPLRPLPIVHRWYATRHQDVLGVVWVSNNAATWVLLTLGVADLLAGRWVGSEPGRILAAWAAGWWAIRAGSQLAFGRRAGDWAFVAIFGAGAAIHGLAVVA